MPKISRLQLAALQIAMITILIRGLSLVRDALVAGHFGVNVEADQFFLILYWANFVTTLVATSALNLYIPRLKLKSGRFGPLFANFYASQYYQLITFFFVLILVGFAFLTNFGWLSVFFCGSIFVTQSLSHFYSSLVNLKSRFVLPSILFGLPIVSTLVFFLTSFESGEQLLGFFALGSALQALCIYLLAREKLKARLAPQNLSRFKSLSGLQSWVWLAAGTLFFPAANFLNIQLAAFLPEGTVATLSYASRIPFAISNVLIFAFWTVALPTTEVSKDRGFLNKQMYLRLVKIGGVTIVFSFFGVFLGEWAVHLLYNFKGNLELDRLSSIVTYQAWYFYVLPAQVVTSLLIRFLHILGEAKVALWVCLLGLGAQVFVFLGFGQSDWTIPVGFALNFWGVGLILAIFTLFRMLSQKRALAGS